MAEPLLYHDQLLGVLVADNQETGRPFSLEDQQILRLLAAQAAIAIENARLYEQVADQRDQLRALSMRAMEMREEETRRIARELHDEVGQSLTGMLLGLQGIEGARTHEEIRERTVELRALVSRSMEDLHNLVAALRPTILDDFGLAPALERYLQGIATGSGLRIRTSLAGLQAMRLPPSVEIALFRIVQEAMTNVVKHAQAHNVHVGAEHWGEALVLFIEEDGQGFDVAKARRDRTQSMGLGLLSMEERATLLGGTLVVQSSPGRGTSLVVEIPLPKD
jgi:signal transduction histidine kinase